MISSTTASSSVRRRLATAQRAGGFTLVELLVVVGIMAAIVALALPTLNKAYQTGLRTRMALDLQAIATGLEAYRADHHTYPIVYAADTGSIVLGRCLIAGDVKDTSGAVIEDGAKGPGFRTRAKVAGIEQGKAYGPYVPTDKFNVSSTGEILDSDGNPILYYVGRPKVNIRTAYVAEATATVQPVFDAKENKKLLPTAKLQNMLGDVGDPRPAAKDPAKPNGTITGSETAAFVGSYLLWSAGPDGVFGPDPKNPYPDSPISASNPCDDVANFDRSPY